MPEARFEIYRDDVGALRFRFLDANGATMAQSPQQQDRPGCLEGITIVQNASSMVRQAATPSGRVVDLSGGESPPAEGTRFEIFRDSSLNYRFRLVSSSETIIQGRGHAAKVDCTNDMYLVINNAPRAQTVDSTARTAPEEPVQFHGTGWILMCRLVQSGRFRGNWWKDLITRNPKRHFPKRCR